VVFPIFKVVAELTRFAVVAALPRLIDKAFVLNTDAVPVDVVTIEGDAPLMFNSVAVPRVTVGALRFRVVPACRVDVPADAEPSVMVVAAPPIFKVVAPVLKSVTVPDAVVRVGPVPKVIVGDAAPKVIAVALGNVTVAFLMLPVPVVAPRLRVVAA
jgi:hypothetical protein